MTHRAWFAALFAALLAVSLGAVEARADDPTLYIDYTMNCTFTIRGDNGSTITVIPPGRYQVLVVSPQPFAELNLAGATDPNLGCGGFVSFRLTGPGVSIFTTLDDGDSSSDHLAATFQAGTYTAQEDRRPTVARVVFTVAAGAPSTGLGTSASSSTGSGTKPATKPAVTVAPKNLRGTLGGSVSTAGKLRLTFKGKAVTSLKSGRYTVSVLDETSRAGFNLQKVGKPATKVTTTSYLGRRAVTLALGAGQWLFYPDGGKKTYFVVTN